jgi:BirA family biotin operon repressor/biotin-[acetyl-CoA-carboxylase] ligase
VTWVAETGSTNADLARAARDGAPHGTVLVADHQTAGRGRLDRTWVAPPNSALLCSILVRARPGALAQRALWCVGLAAQAAAREVAGVEAELKWPNDLMVGDRKLAGILAEVVDPSAEAPAVVVGIGLNVGWPSAPEEVAARAVTLEELAGRPVDRADLLSALLRALVPLLDLWSSDAPALFDTYRAQLATLGQTVLVTVADRQLSGEAVDVTSDGALVVQVGPERCVVAAGDVIHLR